MKKPNCLLSALLLSIISFAQSTPVTPVETLNTFTGATSIFAPFELHSPYSGIGPVVIYNNAQVDFTAGERIHLRPGFQASNFSGSGYFHAQIGAAPDFDVVFIEPNESYPAVGQFEKLEIGLQLNAQLEQQFVSFTQNSSTGINPFDPEQISVEAEFTKGNESYTVYGFYYEEYTRVPWVMDPCNNPFPGCFPAEWFDQNTPYHWRIRFAPPSTGEWKVDIRTYIGTPASLVGEVEDLRFNCVASPNPGFLEVGGDGWHLRHSGTHQSFFGIGQDIAWPDASQFRGDVDPTFPAMYRGGYLDIMDWVTDMSENGGNMTRIVKVPWSYEYEWEELNNYSQRLNRAWELDHLFETAELNEVQMVFCFEHGTFTLDDTGTFIEPHLNWLHNPYRTQLPNIEFPDDFLTAQSCRDIFKKKLRYFMSRWGYSTSLGIFQILSEMDRWTFRNQSNTPHLKHNGPAKTALLNWHTEMLAYSKSLLQYRKLLCSTSYGDAPRDYEIDCAYNSPYVDIVCPKHCYTTRRYDNWLRLIEMNDPGLVWRWDGLMPGVHHLFANKPALTDEMGFHDNGADPNDMDYCSDITFHNSVWATSFNGGLNSGLYWWQWFNNDHRKNFRALANFFSSVDWESERFVKPDYWNDVTLYQNFQNVTIENFSLSSDLNGNNKVMGWVHNASYYWGNITYGTCLDRNNNSTDIDPDTEDDQQTAPAELPMGTEFEIHGLNPFTTYTVDFYATQGFGNYHSSQTVVSNVFGTLKPAWIPTMGDWAYKAYNTNNAFRVTSGGTVDTIGCAPYTVTACGEHQLDSSNTFTYEWNFGDNVQHTGNLISYTYTTPGAFEVTTIVRNGETIVDTLRQTIVVLDCTQSEERKHGYSSIAFPEVVALQPNPTSGIFTIYSLNGEMSSLLIYNSLGQLIVTSQRRTIIQEVDLQDYDGGVYYIHVWIDNILYVRKMVKE